MKPEVLFVIDSDPRVSTRAAEAVRIAAGVAVWRNVHVAIYFHDASTLALGAEPEALIDGESFARHLALVWEAGGSVLKQEADPDLAPSPPVVPVREIDKKELAALMATRDYVLRF